MTTDSTGELLALQVSLSMAVRLSSTLPSFFTCRLHVYGHFNHLLIPTGILCPPGPCPSGMPPSLYLLGGKSPSSSPMSQARLEFSTPTGQTALPAPAEPRVLCCSLWSRHRSLWSQRLLSWARQLSTTHHPPNPERLIATLQGMAPSQDSLPLSLMKA